MVIAEKTRERKATASAATRETRVLRGVKLGSSFCFLKESSRSRFVDKTATNGFGTLAHHQGPKGLGRARRTWNPPGPWNDNRNRVPEQRTSSASEGRTEAST